MSRVVIFGEGKISDVVYWQLKNDSDHEIVSFTADGEYISSGRKFDLPVVPFEDILSKYPPDDFEMFIALGYQDLNNLRAEKYQLAKKLGYRLISCVSSGVSNFGEIEYGDNCLILENTALNPMSSIGSNVFIWNGNHIGHHSRIGDHCYISGQVVISGNTTIGNNCFIGVNSTIGHEITIGERNLIGAGSLITKKTEPNSVFIAAETAKFRLDVDSFLKLTKMK